MKYFGFVYEWEDLENDIRYIGSHVGDETDGYVASNKIVTSIFKKRPHTMKRTIKEYIIIQNKSYLHEREQFYLDLIKDDELYNVHNRKNNTIKYYNMKKQASGGNGVGSNGKMKNKTKYYHRETFVQKFFSANDHISDEWVIGVHSSKVSSAGKIWYTNTITGHNIRSDNPPSDEWIKGRNSKTTGKKLSTPLGIFDSASECSRVCNIKVETISFRCRSKSNKMKDWFYIEENKDGTTKETV